MQTVLPPAMRPVRRALFVAVALIPSCSEPPPDAAARVGEWVLTERRLADLLVLAQPFPLESAPVTELVRHWVGAAALGRRMAAGDSLLDSAAVHAATWLERREALLALEREERLGPSPRITPEVAEAEYRTGGYRLVAHVLRRVGPETSPAERELQRRSAQRILDDLVAGGSWDGAVAESEDRGTRESSGLLGLIAPGDLEPALDRVAFALEPGEVSPVVRGEGGYHLLYRPRFGDVADLFAARLAERRLAEADIASRAVLLEERGAEPGSEAVASVRRLARDPWSGWDSDVALATWDSGTLPERSVARYVLALPAAARLEMAESGEDPLSSFLDEMVVREIRIGDAGRRGIRLDERFLAELEARLAADLERWREVLEGPVGEGASPEMLDRYMEDLVARRAEERFLPPLLEAYVLEGVPWEVVPSVIDAAVLRARSMLGSAGGGNDGTASTPSER